MRASTAIGRAGTKEEAAEAARERRSSNRERSKKAAVKRLGGGSSIGTTVTLKSSSSPPERRQSSDTATGGRRERSGKRPPRCSAVGVSCRSASSPLAVRPCASSNQASSSAGHAASAVAASQSGEEELRPRPTAHAARAAAARAGETCETDEASAAKKVMARASWQRCAASSSIRLCQSTCAIASRRTAPYTLSMTGTRQTLMAAEAPIERSTPRCPRGSAEVAAPSPCSASTAAAPSGVRAASTTHAASSSSEPESRPSAVACAAFLRCDVGRRCFDSCSRQT
mmetsp:Transcript_8700/g.28892  ORF Transcript_8700/g.28892 Transcript_8700/m.28892 type:complete len:285 (-) Transcript_8700:244-1098(-)